MQSIRLLTRNLNNYKSQKLLFSTKNAQNFIDMIKLNKNIGKKMILLENLSPPSTSTVTKSSVITKQILNEFLNIKIHEFWSWNYRRRNFILICLNDLNDVEKILSNCGYNSHSLPIRTRMLETKSLPSSSSLDNHDNNSHNHFEYNVNNVDKSILNCKELRENFPTNEQLIRHLTEMNSLNELDYHLRYFLITQLEEILCQSIFNDFSIYPFGSSLTGLGDSRSDLDLALLHSSQIDHDNGNKKKKIKNKINFSMTELKSERDQIQQCLSLIADIIKQFIPNISKINRILRARIPIVKMSFDLAPIEIDISIELSHDNGHHGLLMANYLHYCASKHLNIKQFLLFIKLWSKQHCIVKSIPGNWFSNFQILSLALYFLQKENLVKSIDDFNKDTENSEHDSSHMMNTMKMIHSFFEFLIEFNFEAQAISIKKGTSFIKPDFSPIYIENPMEPTLNICKNINGVELKKLLLQSYNSLDVIYNQNFHLSDLLDVEHFKTLEKQNNCNNNR